MSRQWHLERMFVCKSWHFLHFTFHPWISHPLIKVHDNISWGKRWYRDGSEEEVILTAGPGAPTTPWRPPGPGGPWKHNEQWDVHSETCRLHSFSARQQKKVIEKICTGKLLLLIQSVYLRGTLLCGGEYISIFNASATKTNVSLKKTDTHRACCFFFYFIFYYKPSNHLGNTTAPQLIFYMLQAV